MNRLECIDVYEDNEQDARKHAAGGSWLEKGRWLIRERMKKNKIFEVVRSRSYLPLL